MARNHHSNSNNKIMLGLLAGTVVGAIAAAVASTKKGKHIRENLQNAYDTASKKVTGAANSISETTHDLTDRYLGRNHRSNNNINLAVGAIAGGILGVSTIIFLTSKSTKGLREQVAHSFESMTDKAHVFEDLAHSAFDRFGENVAPWVKKIESIVNALNENGSKRKSSGSSHQPIDTILDWASVAAQLLQSLKK